MKLFKDVSVGESFFTDGALELIRVENRDDCNCTVKGESLGIFLKGHAKTYSSIRELVSADSAFLAEQYMPF